MAGVTDEYLSSLFSDSFKREIDADEAVWRSLPFFAAIIGLAIAILPSVYRAAAEIAALGWKIAIYVLLACSILCFVLAARWFWDVIRIRPYRYPPTDEKILEYAAKLREFYRSRKMPADARDNAVRGDLREFMIREFALATTTNRRNNAAKIRARSLVLLSVAAGFLFAFLCEATILISQALVNPAS